MCALFGKTHGDQDWHPADIVVILRKRGHSLSGLSIANGYHPTAAGKALKQSWPAMEQILAEAVGVTPETIWPSRYSVARPSCQATPEGAYAVGWSPVADFGRTARQSPASASSGHKRPPHVSDSSPTRAVTQLSLTEPA
jgi:Ner family transcriptional regulator